MSFWQFCEKIQCCVGLKRTLRHIQVIYELYEKNKTVDEVAEAINLSDPLCLRDIKPKA